MDPASSLEVEEAAARAARAPGEARVESVLVPARVPAAGGARAGGRGGARGRGREAGQESARRGEPSGQRGTLFPRVVSSPFCSKCRKRKAVTGVKRPDIHYVYKVSKALHSVNTQ